MSTNSDKVNGARPHEPEGGNANTFSAANLDTTDSPLPASAAAANSHARTTRQSPQGARMRALVDKSMKPLDTFGFPARRHNTMSAKKALMRNPVCDTNGRRHGTSGDAETINRTDSDALGSQALLATTGEYDSPITYAGSAPFASDNSSSGLSLPSLGKSGQSRSAPTHRRSSTPDVHNSVFPNGYQPRDGTSRRESAPVLYTNAGRRINKNAIQSTPVTPSSRRKGAQVAIVSPTEADQLNTAQSTMDPFGSMNAAAGDVPYSGDGGAPHSTYGVGATGSAFDIAPTSLYGAGEFGDDGSELARDDSHLSMGSNVGLDNPSPDSNDKSDSDRGASSGSDNSYSLGGNSPGDFAGFQFDSPMALGHLGNAVTARSMKADTDDAHDGFNGNNLLAGSGYGSEYEIGSAPPSALRGPRLDAQASTNSVLHHSPASTAPVALTAVSSSSCQHSGEDHTLVQKSGLPSAFAVFRHTFFKGSVVKKLRAPLSFGVRSPSTDSDDDDYDDEDDEEDDDHGHDQSYSGNPDGPGLRRTKDLLPSKWAYVTKFAEQVRAARQSKIVSQPKRSLLRQPASDDEEEVELSVVLDENGNPMMEPTLSMLWSDNVSTASSSADIDDLGVAPVPPSDFPAAPPGSPINGTAQNGRQRMVRPPVNAQRYAQQQQFMRANVAAAMQQQQFQQHQHQKRVARRQWAKQQQYHQYQLQQQQQQQQQQYRSQAMQQQTVVSSPGAHYASSPANLMPNDGATAPTPPAATPPMTKRSTVRRLLRLQGPEAGERMVKSDRVIHGDGGVVAYISFRQTHGPPLPQPDLEGPKLRGKTKGPNIERMFGESLNKARWVDSPRRANRSPGQKTAHTPASTPSGKPQRRNPHARPRQVKPTTPASRPSSAASNSSKDSLRRHRRKAK